MENFKLFGSYTSPFVRHCRIVFAQTETDYMFVEADYTASGEASPTKRVPYLHGDTIKLHDSMAIIQYIRQQKGQNFLATVEQTEQFALANTVLDTAINLFLLENSGISAPNNPFLQRQRGRIDSGLQALDAMVPSNPTRDKMNDADWRVACLLDWGLFRQRLTLDNVANLRDFLNTVKTWDIFVKTDPAVSDK